MIRGFHCIFGTYGFWLPNDPRGSGSDYIAVWELFRYGPATKTNSRSSVAAAPHNSAQRQQAKAALAYPPVLLSDVQVGYVAGGFSTAAAEGSYCVHACAILPDHVHLVIGPHARHIRQIVGHFKSKATRALRESPHWHADRRSLWGEHGWNVFLNDVADVERAISYVEANPLKEGRPVQHWEFVTRFDPAANRSASQATRLNDRRRIGGAAVASQERKRRS